jgi:serine/threonine protein phosphatase PrpC
VRDENFPWNPKEAIRRGFAAAEEAWLRFACSEDELDKSGSTGCVVMIINDVCFVANVGDSRAIMSGSRGTKVYPLTKDHKPNE